jgi:hypothetical protein
MADAELPQPPFGIVVPAAGRTTLRNQANDSDTGGGESGESITIEPAQVGRHNHCAGRSCGSRGEQVGKVDATPNHDDAEVLVLES